MVAQSNMKYDFCQLGKAVLETEAQAIHALCARLDTQFVKACETLITCEGRIIVTGMGKSGHIAHKIAATLASTGSPSFFVHPGEASHGDLGMITVKDVVLALSNSGLTEEILTILPLIKRLNVPLITLTGNPHSTLALAANVNLDTSIEKEACPLGLAPTASTTAMLAMGDALAIALLQARGFTAEDFAWSHPAGNLGRRLLLHIDDLYVKGEAVPIISPDAKITEALLEMTSKSLGMTLILDKNKKLLGIYTDGDLRRTLDKAYNLQETPIHVVMTSHCKSIQPGMLASEAIQLMEQYKITALPVVDADNHALGVLHMHHLLQAKVM
jgi:arabinose-5-phosphate isomerase